MASFLSIFAGELSATVLLCQLSYTAIGCGRTRTCALRRNRRTSPPTNSSFNSSPGNGRRGTGISARRGPKSHGPEVTAIYHHRRTSYPLHDFPLLDPIDRLYIYEARAGIGRGTSDNGTLGVLPFRPRGHIFPRQDSNLHLPRSRRSNRSLHHRPILLNA